MTTIDWLHSMRINPWSQGGRDIRRSQLHDRGPRTTAVVEHLEPRCLLSVAGTDGIVDSGLNDVALSEQQLASDAIECDSDEVLWSQSDVALEWIDGSGDREFADETEVWWEVEYFPDPDEWLGDADYSQEWYEISTADVTNTEVDEWMWSDDCREAR